MLVVWPFAHISTDFRQNRLGDGGADAVDGDQVHTRHPENMRPGVASWGVLAVGMRLPWRCGGARRWGLLGGGFEARFNDGEGAFNLGVTCAELGGIEIKQCQGLLQNKEMLLTPGAGEGACDLVEIF